MLNLILTLCQLSGTERMRMLMVTYIAFFIHKNILDIFLKYLMEEESKVILFVRVYIDKIIIVAWLQFY